MRGETMPRKVCVVITARPSYARIKSALHAIRQHPGLELQIVVAASALLDRFGNTVKVIEEEGFKVDRRVYMVVDGENLITAAKSTGLGLAELSTAFDDLKPDVVVTIADRYETIAPAIAACYMNIPLAHVQGGEVTGSIDEKVRHAITKLADLHLVASERAAARVIGMGERPQTVFVTGCPSIDLACNALAYEPRSVAETLSGYGGVGPEIDTSRGYMVVMLHPVTSEYELAAEQARIMLEAVDEIGYPTLWFWPNVDAGSDGMSKAIRTYREQNSLDHVHFYKNLKPLDFLSILINSRGIAGNSSVAIRECAYLGVPAVNVGSRQAGRDRGINVSDAAYQHGAIISALRAMWHGSKLPTDTIYGDGTAGQKIADALAITDFSIDKRLVELDVAA
jgi:UDP-hydrolysing UDP-N-acetyl-D-glucosamine 2-epimerase